MRSVGDGFRAFVAVLRGSRQHRLEDRFDTLCRERVEARPGRLGQRDGTSANASAWCAWPKSAHHLANGAAVVFPESAIVL